MINNVVTAAGGQQRGSAIHIHASILPQTPLPSRLPHNTEQSSLCCTVRPCRLAILNTAECTSPPPFPCFFFWWCPAICWILDPQTGINPVPPAGEGQSFNHWTTREVPKTMKTKGQFSGEAVSNSCSLEMKVD